MPPIIVSVSDFRANMMTLYRRYISPESASQRPVEVRDMKRDKRLFIVEPEKNHYLNQDRLKKYVQQLKTVKKNIEFNDKHLNSFRESFNQNMKNRLVSAHGYFD